MDCPLQCSQCLSINGEICIAMFDSRRVRVLPDAWGCEDCTWPWPLLQQKQPFWDEIDSDTFRSNLNLQRIPATLWHMFFAWLLVLRVSGIRPNPCGNAERNHVELKTVFSHMYKVAPKNKLSWYIYIYYYIIICFECVCIYIYITNVFGVSPQPQTAHSGGQMRNQN